MGWEWFRLRRPEARLTSKSDSFSSWNLTTGRWEFTAPWQASQGQEDEVRMRGAALLNLTVQWGVIRRVRLVLMRMGWFDGHHLVLSSPHLGRMFVLAVGWSIIGSGRVAYNWLRPRTRILSILTLRWSQRGNRWTHHHTPELTPSLFANIYEMERRGGNWLCDNKSKVLIDH